MKPMTYGDLLRNPSMLARAAALLSDMQTPFDQVQPEETTMKTYIGIKRVEATPCAEGQWKVLSPSTIDPLAMGRDGYKVRYSDDYESWSPADAFNEAYIEVPPEGADQLVTMLRDCVREDGAHLFQAEPPSDFTGRPDDGPWRVHEEKQQAAERRSKAISYALQATQPYPSMNGIGGMTPPRSVEQVVHAAEKILAFMEGAKSQDDREAAVEAGLREHGRRVEVS